MRSSFLFRVLAILTCAVAAPLTGCGFAEVDQCACPVGTDYQFVTTYSVFGVNAQDFQQLTADFYNTDWLRTPLTSTNGPNNTPGSTRSFNIKTDAGTYPFTEELIEFNTKPDGSFIQRLAQLSTPIEYSSTDGSLAGFWVTLESEYASQNETVIRWRVNACFTGHPINFAAFTTGALKNAISIFKAQGKLIGDTSGPYAVQSF